MTLVPDIVQETTTFCQILNEYAKEQTLFTMKSLTDNLAMDVIGKIVLDADLNAQRTKNPMVIALRRQMSWLTFGNEGFPMQRYNPARPFINAYNTYQMDKYLSPKVDARFQIHQDRNRDLKRSKSVIDLALTAYFSDSGHESSNHGLNPRFKSLLMSQVKLFLFSGHDTTSSTICYIFYVLSVYPSVLQRLRAEHDSVFGSDVSKTASLIACDSHLLNQLPYTVAVIKETMRLFPAASTTRSGEPGFTIKDPDRGREYPTFGYLVWLIPHAVQRDPEYWPQPDRFLPERWLVSPGNILHPKKGTLRPFEHGPRSCIGKEMSMIEMKIVLALTSREFQITTVYDEVDRDSSTGIRTVDGERAYQVQHGQPSGNLPCRVTRIVE